MSVRNLRFIKSYIVLGEGKVLADRAKMASEEVRFHSDNIIATDSAVVTVVSRPYLGWRASKRKSRDPVPEGAEL